MQFTIRTKKIRRRAEDAAFGAAEAVRAGTELVGRGAEGVLDRLRLEKAIRDLQGEIDLQTQIVGELTYAVHRGEIAGGVEDILEYLDSLHEDLEDCRRQLDAMRGALICAACGASNDSVNVYCTSCGHPLGSK